MGSRTHLNIRGAPQTGISRRSASIYDDATSAPKLPQEPLHAALLQGVLIWDRCIARIASAISEDFWRTLGRQ